MWPVPNGQVNVPIIMSIALVSPIFWPKRAAGRICGPRDMVSAPPARANSASPSIRDCAAETMA